MEAVVAEVRARAVIAPLGPAAPHGVRDHSGRAAGADRRCDGRRAKPAAPTSSAIRRSMLRPLVATDREPRADAGGKAGRAAGPHGRLRPPPSGCWGARACSAWCCRASTWRSGTRWRGSGARSVCRLLGGCGASPPRLRELRGDRPSRDLEPDRARRSRQGFRGDQDQDRRRDAGAGPRHGLGGAGGDRAGDRPDGRLQSVARPCPRRCGGIARSPSFDLAWVEEPVPAEDLQGHAAVRAAETARSRPARTGGFPRTWRGRSRCAPATSPCST